MVSSRSAFRISLLYGVLLTVMAACSSSTSPGSVMSFEQILAHRAVWRAQGLTDYSFTYQFTSFNALANQPLQLEVRNDTVRSVLVQATGQRTDPKYFPTIDKLFERALAASINGSLRRVTFDDARGYPTHIGYATVPDGLSAQQASALQPLP